MPGKKHRSGQRTQESAQEETAGDVPKADAEQIISPAKCFARPDSGTTDMDCSRVAREFFTSSKAQNNMT